MGERTRYTPGTFCFADLGTDDRDAAASFYGGLFGWNAEASQGAYTMFTLEGNPVAGMFQAPAGYPNSWLSYVSVEDADVITAEARELGASVPLEPRAVSDEAEIGRSALVKDPQGALVALWEPGLHVGAGLVNEVGTMVWNQLATSDVEAAMGFYAELLGWTTEPVDDGQGGYWNWRNRDGWLNAGVTALPDEDAPPHWQVWFTVEDAAGGVARAQELGGTELVPAVPTPLGEDVAVLRDPTGAAFVLFAGDIDP
jgi:predicted enzyme related to lactoylglutathione lyase